MGNAGTVNTGATDDLETLTPLARLERLWLHVDSAFGALAEILLRLQEEGLAVPSSTAIEGRFAIRVAICNHRSQCEDLDFLVEQVMRLGTEING